MTVPACRATLTVDARCTLGEGIVWDERRGALLWTDIQGSRLWMYTRETSVTRTWALPSRLGALTVCQSGKLLLGFAKSLSIVDIEPSADVDRLAVRSLIDVEPTQPSTRVNDGRTDRAGHFVFGTLNEHPDRAPVGSFYQFSSQHGLRQLQLGHVGIPNSICFSPDGRTMYYCDSLDRRIMQCEYDADEARVSNIRELVRFAADQGLPDGSVVDADGCVWNAEWGSSLVRRYTPQGRIDRQIAVPTKNPTCVTFGGPRLDELYITSSRQEMSVEELDGTPSAGGVYRAKPGVSGIPDQPFKNA